MYCDTISIGFIRTYKRGKTRVEVRALREFLRRMMLGRYGPDHLGTTMFIFAFLLSIIFSIIGFASGSLLPMVIMLLAFFRMYSRNIPARRRENDRFLTITAPIRSRVRKSKNAFRDRKTHRFFACPACRNTLRVPRGRGKIQITCPRCGERFVKKT